MRVLSVKQNHKCENKCVCVCMRVYLCECVLSSAGRERGVHVKDRWSLSGVVPPLPISFSLPSFPCHLSRILPHLFSFPQHLLNPPPFKVWAWIFTHSSVLFSLCPQLLLFCCLVLFLAEEIALKIPRDFSLWESFWHLLTQHVDHWCVLGFVGANKNISTKKHKGCLTAVASELLWDPFLLKLNLI